MLLDGSSKSHQSDDISLNAASSTPNNPVQSKQINLINELSRTHLLPFLVPAIPPTELLSALHAQGFSDSLDVLQWVRGQTLVNIFDFEIWEFSQEKCSWDVNVSQVLEWISHWQQIDVTFAAQRFFELEEETIVLILSKLFQVIPVGYSENENELVENEWLSLDKRFYLIPQIPSDSDIIDVLKPFVDSMYAVDFKFAGSCFAHAAMLVRHEVMEEGERIRNSRLSDQGFVSQEEAHRILFSQTDKTLREYIQQRKNAKRIKMQTQSPTASLDLLDEQRAAIQHRVFEVIRTEEHNDSRNLIRLACAQDLPQIVGSQKQNTALEHFYDDEEFLQGVSESIEKSCQLWLNHFHAATQSIQHSPAQSSLLIDEIFSNMREENPALWGDLKSHLARCTNMLISHTKMTFAAPKTLEEMTAVTRGFLNLGLELAWENRTDLGWTFDEKSVDEPNSSPEKKMQNMTEGLQVYGLEFFFQYAWLQIQNLQRDMIKIVEAADSQNQWHTPKEITFADGTKHAISLDKMIATGRCTEIRRFIDSLYVHLPEEIYVVLSSFFAKIPRLSLAFDATSSLSPVFQQSRNFQTQQDFQEMARFSRNLNTYLAKSLEASS